MTVGSTSNKVIEPVVEAQEILVADLQRTCIEQFPLLNYRITNQLVSYCRKTVSKVNKTSKIQHFPNSYI